MTRVPQRKSVPNQPGPASHRTVLKGGQPKVDSHDVTQFNASGLLGVAVGTANGPGGRLRDLIVRPRGDGEAEVQSLVVRCDRRQVRVESSAIRDCHADKITVSVEPSDQSEFAQRDGELLVLRQLLDAEAIDRNAQRVVRINDAVIEWDGAKLACTAIDASAGGLWRRLLPRQFSGEISSTTVPWREIEPMIEPPPGLDFGISHSRLSELHPSDIAKLIDHLPFRQGARILGSLEAQLAADTLEEVERARQPEILDYVPQDRAVAILNDMAPDAAADLLEVVPRRKSDRLIGLLEPKVSSDIRLLLSYPSDSAAGLMTTDFVMALEDEAVEEAIDYVRGQLRRPDLVYYVYIVDNATDRRLRGVMSLRDLLLAKAGSVLRDCMGPAPRTTRPEEHAKEVARVMGEYNLLALPVVDGQGRMLGLVTADDVLDLVLPEAMRQHLPRLFS